MDPKQLNDHDLLITLNTKVDMLIKGQDNHLTHHSRRAIAMLSVTLSAIFAAVVAIITTSIVVFRG